MQVSLMDKQRIDWVDTAKFFAITLMIFGHLPRYVPNVDSTPMIFLYSFHMQLFFFLSGLTCKTEDFFSTVKKTFRGLFIPYICCYIFLWFWTTRYCDIRDFVLNILRHPSIITHRSFIDFFRPHVIIYPFWQVYTTDTPFGFMGEAWFIYALFWCKILYAFVENYIRKGNHIIVHLLVAFCGSMLISHLIRKGIIIRYTLTVWPAAIDKALLAYPFFLLGKLLSPSVFAFGAKRMSRDIVIKLLLAFVFFIITSSMSIMNFFQDVISINDWLIGKSTYMFYVNSFCGIFASICLCSAIKAPCIVNFYGRNTLIILFFQWFAVSMAKHIIIGGEGGGYSFMAGVFYTILNLVFCTIPILIMTKGLPWTMGKKIKQ